MMTVSIHPPKKPANPPSTMPTPTERPAPSNPAFKALQDHYRKTGDEGAANAVEERMKQLKPRKRR